MTEFKKYLPICAFALFFYDWAMKKVKAQIKALKEQSEG
jgi:hypothetical protein